jgi:hypothetical protein
MAAVKTKVSFRCVVNSSFQQQQQASEATTIVCRSISCISLGSFAATLAQVGQSVVGSWAQFQDRRGIFDCRKATEQKRMYVQSRNASELKNRRVQADSRVSFTESQGGRRWCDGERQIEEEERDKELALAHWPMKSKTRLWMEKPLILAATMKWTTHHCTLTDLGAKLEHSHHDRFPF